MKYLTIKQLDKEDIKEDIKEDNKKEKEERERIDNINIVKKKLRNKMKVSFYNE